MHAVVTVTVARAVDAESAFQTFVSVVVTVAVAKVVDAESAFDTFVAVVAVMRTVPASQVL